MIVIPGRPGTRSLPWCVLADPSTPPVVSHAGPGAQSAKLSIVPIGTRGDPSPGAKHKENRRAQ